MATHSESLHTRVDHAVNSEMRLMYGIGLPFLAGVGLIIAFAITNQWWLLVPTVLVLLALMAVITIGLMQMLDDKGEDDEAARTAR